MVNETTKSRPPGIAWARLLLGIPLLSGVLLLHSVREAPAAPSLSDAIGGGDFTTSWEDAQRGRDLDAWTKEIEAGVRDLQKHYIDGGDSPPLPAAAIDFLLFRASAANRPDLRDVALGTVAVYAAMNAHDYVKQGIEISPRVFEKRGPDEARLLMAFSSAWRASGKDIFRRTAETIGDDLLAWTMKPGADPVGIVQLILPDSAADAWIRGSPDFGDAEKTAAPGEPTRVVFRLANAVEGSEIAAALLEAGLVFDRPAWVKAARASRMTRDAAARVRTSSNPARRIEASRRLLAVMNAAAARPHPSWGPAAAYWAGEILSTSTVAPADSIADGWAALALMRYSTFAHDDSAHHVALRLLDRIDPPEAPPRTRDPQVFEAQAALALALNLHENPVPMAYIVGDPKAATTDSLVTTAIRSGRAGRLVTVHAPDEADLLYPASSDGKPIVYVCSGEMCAPPVESPADLKELLETFALPDATTGNPGVGRSQE